LNLGGSIEISQQVDHDTPKIVSYLKTDAAYRQIDRCQNVANYLHAFVAGKHGLLFQIRKDTPFLHNNLEQRWLTPRLKTMGIDEKGMGFHAFRRFRKTWLRGKRCQEDINNFWMGHKPKTVSELYSRMDEELEQRIQEAEIVGVGFEVPAYVDPKCSKLSVEQEVAIAA
jgi:integrase